MVFTGLNDKVREVTAGVELVATKGRGESTIDFFATYSKGTTTSVTLTFTAQDDSIGATKFAIAGSEVLSANGSTYFSVAVPKDALSIFVTASPAGDDTTTPANVSLGVIKA